MALTNQSILNHSAISCVAQLLGHDFNVDTTTNLYIVPPGKEFTPFAVLISNSSGNMTTATASFGKSDALTDFLGTQTLTGINAAGDSAWCMPAHHATVPVGLTTMAASEIFSIDHVVAQGGAMTADVSLFGFLNDA